jgi:spermidine/putrescine transport system ATP-binding protein
LTNLAIEARNISLSFGSRTVLCDVSLHVSQGEFLSIVGPSGCGKTVFLKTLCDVVSPSSGEVLSNNVPIKGRSATEHGIVMVWQSLALFPHMNVEENVSFALSVQRIQGRERQARVSDALDAVGLLPLAQRGVKNLSGGEKQRLALARALAIRPQVLLLDEPMRGLDYNLRKEVISHIKSLHLRYSMAVVLVTHDLDEAFLHSNRVAIMSDGKLLQIAAPQQILSEPSSAVVARLTGSNCNLISVTVNRMHDNFADVTVGDRTITVTIAPWTQWGDRVNATAAVIVEPCDVNIAKPDGGTGLAARVTGRQQTHWGEILELDCNGAGTMRCERVSDAVVSPISVGENVSVTWKAEHARLIPLGRQPTEGITARD